MVESRVKRTLVPAPLEKVASNVVDWTIVIGAGASVVVFVYLLARIFFYGTL